MEHLVSPLYVASWKHILNTFKDTHGKSIPSNQRKAILDYVTEGEVPSGVLLGLLTRDFANVFTAETTPLERARIFTIWEFINTVLYSRAWGGLATVHRFATEVQEGWIGNVQRDFVDVLMEKTGDDVYVD
jgi:hypothetical protein